MSIGLGTRGTDLCSLCVSFSGRNIFHFVQYFEGHCLSISGCYKLWLSEASSLQLTLKEFVICYGTHVIDLLRTLFSNPNAHQNVLGSSLILMEKMNKINQIKDSRHVTIPSNLVEHRERSFRKAALEKYNCCLL